MTWPGREETFWYHGLVPGAELVVFEHSSYVPHLEEPQRYLQVLRDFLHRAEEAPSRKPGSARSRRLRDGPVASLVHIGLEAARTGGPDRKAWSGWPPL
jgi:hypothetical protein